MAYQPKSYRKFLATSVTAAVVASAVAPVAALAADENVITNDFVDVDKDKHSWAVEAIDYLVGKKAIEGKGNKTFDIHGNLTRAEAAAILARTLELDVDKNAKPNFSDTDGHWGAPEIAAIQNDLSGVIEGYQGKFNPNNNITRQELAKIIVEAYELELVEGADVDFPDNNGWGEDYVKILASNGIVIGKPNGNFEPNAYVSRGEAAVFFHRTEVESARVEVPGVDVPLTVDSVSATNQTTLTITGAGLDKLKAEDIEIEDNSVSSISVSNDGKTATINLSSELVIDEETTVTVGGKDYTVTYSIEADEVSVVEATYDDDTTDQYVSIKVNGTTLTAQELINAGYTVKFEAFKTKAASDDVTDALFESAKNGELETNLSEEGGAFLNAMDKESLPTDGLDVYVKVTLTKGSDIISSDLAKIKIQNLDLVANGITDYVLTNITKADNHFEQNSSTLVSGETAEISEITVKAGSEEEDLDEGYTLESSDKSVITVSGNEITAQGPGTATLTIKYGGVTKTVSITVKNDTREVKSVKLDKPSLKVGVGQTTDSKIFLLDQYGDPFAGTVQLEVSKKDIIKVVNKDGAEVSYNSFEIGNKPEEETKIYVEGYDKGSVSITFSDAEGVKIGTTTLKVEVSDNTDLSKFDLKVDDDISTSDLSKINEINGIDELTKDDISEKTEIDFGENGEKYVKIDLKAFNSQGFELKGNVTDEDQYTATSSPSRAGVIKEVHKADGFIVVEAGDKTGTATIEVKSTQDSQVSQTIKITVVDKGYNVTGVTFKNFANPTYSQTIDYTNVLTYKEGANDPIISGLKLTKDTSYPIRLNVTDDADNQGEFYIDKNANGKYDDGERVIGTLQLDTDGEIADDDFNAIDGIDVAKGDDGTLLFKVVDNAGKVVGTKAIEVDF